MLTINTTKNSQRNAVSTALKLLESGLRDTDLSPTLSNITMSMESIDQVGERTFATATANLDSILTSVIQTTGLYSSDNEALESGLAVTAANAAAYGALLALDPSAILAQEVQPSQSNNNNHRVIGELGGGLATRKVAIEAYDEKSADNMVEYTAAYNLFAPNPGAFVSANFPVITIDPAQTGLKITADLLYVQTDAVHKTSGEVTNFQRRSLTRATIDPSILQPDVTRIIPVVRTESADKFADPANLPVRTIVYNDVPIDTAPLLFGKRIGLIGISQDDRLVTRGVMGLEDQLDVDIQLTSVYVKVGDDVFKLSTKGITTSRFVASRQESTTGMNLNFTSDHLLVTKDTVDVASAPLVTLAGITTADLKVRIRLGVSGTADIDTGEIVAHANEIAVTKVFDAAGEELDLDAAPALAIAALFETAEFLGYELYATRSNTDLRQRGHIIGNSTYSEEYFIGLGSPITAIRPINTARDDSDLRGLIAASHIRMTAEAIDKLVETSNVLSGITSTGVNDFPEVLGIGRLYVRPTFMEEYVDVAQQITSQNSFETIRDMAALLINIVKDTAARMYIESGMAGAKSVLNPTGNVKTTCVISTSSYIASYLSSPMNATALEDKLFNYIVVHDPNAQLYGKMYLTFHQIDDSRNTEPNILSFGCMPYVPDVVFNLNITRSGQHSRELCVHPRHKCIVLSPVMGVIHVRNITNALGKQCICLIDEAPDPISSEWS